MNHAKIFGARVRFTDPTFHTPQLLSVHDAHAEAPRHDGRDLFSSKIFCKIDTVAFSFVFDKYCPIMK